MARNALNDALKDAANKYIDNGATANGDGSVKQAGGNGTAVASPTNPNYVTSGTPTNVTATIANGAALSGNVAVAGKVVGLIVPAAWTAAALTFTGSVDGINFYPIYDDGIERTVASTNVIAGRFLSLDLNDWLPFTHIQVRSGTAAAPVNQGASRAIIIALAG